MGYQLNLIDERALPVPVRPSVAAMLTLALLCGGVGFTHLRWEGARLARSLAQPGADAVASSEDLPADPAYETRLRVVQRDERLRDALAGFRDLPQDSAARLQQLAAALPDALWLTDVQLSGSRGVRIVGGTIEPAALAAYASRLGQVPAFSGLPMQALILEPTHDAVVRRDADQAASAAAPPRAVQHHFVLTSGQMQADDEPLK
jgi:Tfp pilus assembly protein PilN